MKINSKITVVFLVSLLTLSTATALFSVSAHTPAMSFPTYAYLSVQPNPAGLGQAVFVNFWLDKPPPTAADQYGDRWHGFKVTVTKPDGTTEDLQLGSHSNSDAVGGSYTTYTPASVGSYTFIFSFPGQTINGDNPNPITGTASAAYVGDYYEPSTSEPVTLVVQQQQVTSVPAYPLPTDYWSRPIYAENTEWYSIAGNWLGYNNHAVGGFAGGGSYSLVQNLRLEGNFAPFTTAPNTSHIVWTKSYAPGGLIGGEFGNNQESSMYYAAAQYETKFAPIIMNGVLYYSVMPGASTNRAGWAAVDLRTGKELWFKQTTEALQTGQILDFVTPNQYGGILYLWSRPVTNIVNSAGAGPNAAPIYRLYDAMTGNWILDIVNITDVTLMSDKNGNLIAYYINSTSNTLNLWNSTKAIMEYNLMTRTAINQWVWRPPQGASIPFSYGIQWTKPLVLNMTASNGTVVNINTAYAQASGAASNLGIKRVDFDTGVVILHNLPIAAFTEPGWAIFEGYSTTTGELLWGPINQTFPAWCKIWDHGGGSGVFTMFVNEALEWYGFDMKTGQKLWGPVNAPANSWSYYQIHGIVAYDNLYTADIGGYVCCYDVKTGNLKWSWNTGSSGYETPYGIWPIINFNLIADGKVYVQGGHMYSPPLYHGSLLYCLDAYTGQQLWNISSFGIANHAASAIADGYLLVPNAYDNQVYCYNKGPSATTVTAPDIAVPLGTSVMIRGTVTDQSPGQTAIGVPAAGTPAIADVSMQSWMEYLYQQKPKPTNATGVPVKLTAVDANGAETEIATVTSDITGMFFYKWTPPATGTFKIIADFEGTNSYYPSSAQTVIGVDSTSAVIPTPTQTIAPTNAPTTAAPTATVTPSPIVENPSGIPTETILIAGAAVVIVAVIAAAAVLLKKRQ